MNARSVAARRERRSRRRMNSGKGRAGASYEESLARRRREEGRRSRFADLDKSGGELCKSSSKIFATTIDHERSRASGGSEQISSRHCNWRTDTSQAASRVDFCSCMYKNYVAIFLYPNKRRRFGLHFTNRRGNCDVLLECLLSTPKRDQGNCYVLEPPRY